jgi:hypothetical protein
VTVAPSKSALTLIVLNGGANVSGAVIAFVHTFVQ